MTPLWPAQTTPPMIAADIADIDATIAHWDRTGVDFCDAWWALGQRTVCERGWGQVRALMIRMTLQRRVPAPLLAA